MVKQGQSAFLKEELLQVARDTFLAAKDGLQMAVATHATIHDTASHEAWFALVAIAQGCDALKASANAYAAIAENYRRKTGK